MRTKGVRGLLVSLVLFAAAGTAAAQDFVVHGQLVCQTGYPPIQDTSVGARFPTTIPGCCKKLVVLTQCYGGDFLDEFLGMPNTAVMSATDGGELSYYGYYEYAAAFALLHQSGRSAADMHAEALANANTRETPQTGGGMALSLFPLTMTSSSARSKLHIIYYAGKPEQTAAGPGDQTNLGIIFEHNFGAEIVVVSSGILASQSQFESTQNGFAMAMESVGSHMTGCDHLFVLFVSDHGEQTFTDIVRTSPPGNLIWGTQALPPSVAGDLWSTLDPRPLIVIFVPLYGTGTTVAVPGPPLFAAGAWQVSFPITGGTFSTNQFVQVPIGGEDGVVGDDPGDGIRLEFPIPVATFIDAFVGHTNVVTITNNSGAAWGIEPSLDPGPIGMIPQPATCTADFNGDGNVGTDADIESFFACLAGNCCVRCASNDFNGDGNVGTDADIESFFRVLAGGDC